MFAHGSASLQLFPVVWTLWCHSCGVISVVLLQKTLGVICYDRQFSVRLQKLFQGLVSNELTAYLSIFNQFKLNELMNYGHIIKSM